MPRKPQIVERKVPYVACAWRTAWLLFDLDNGHKIGGDAGRGYVWVFRARKEALAHKKTQRKMPFAAQLSEPIKATCRGQK